MAAERAHRLRTFAVLLGVATVLCALGLFNDNIYFYMGSMLISPILDLPIEMATENTLPWRRALILLVLPIVGWVLGRVNPKQTAYLDNVSRNYVLHPASFGTAIAVGFLCGLILPLSQRSPVLAVAINLATSLLPQTIGLGYFVGASEYGPLDALACFGVFAANFVTLYAGAKVARHVGLK